MKKMPIKNMNQLDILKEIQTLEEMMASNSTAIVRQASVVEFEPKEMVMNLGEEPEYLYFVLQGRAKIYMVHENRKRSLLQFISTGDIIGELSLLEVEKQTKDIMAADTLVCLAIPLSVAKTILLKDNQFMNYLSKYLAEKLLIRVNHFTNGQNYELKYRLATYLLTVEVDGMYTEKKTETAEFLGVSYRHLIHTLKQFQQQGLLVKEGTDYRINKKELKKLEIKNFF